jgi:ATP-binding cassette, subfamily B, bacterial HlyB/CyaB
VLIIAHRLSTLRMADRIITIERGRLIEDGPHEELIRNGGRYAALHRLQSGLKDITSPPFAAGHRSGARRPPSSLITVPEQHESSIRSYEPH